MPIVMVFMKSGDHIDRVAKRDEINLASAKKLRDTNGLQYLGTELPAIGEYPKMGDFAGPDHVLLEVGSAVAPQLGQTKHGYFLVKNLKPKDAHA